MTTNPRSDATNRPSPPPFVVQARRLAASGRPLDALRLLDAALTKNPDIPQALRVSAEILLSLGAAQPALQALDRFRKIAPNRVIGHLLAAQANELLRNYDQSAECLERAYELNPDIADAPALRARLAERGNELQEARVWVDRALRADPQHPIARMVAAKLDARSGDSAAACKALEDLAADQAAMDRMAPTMRAAVHHELGSLYDKEQQYQQAWRSHLQSASERFRDPVWKRTDPATAYARVNESRELIRTGFLNGCPKPSESSSPVVFLVGLPRSGTTLTEQLLAKHARFVPTDEQTPLAPLIANLNQRDGKYSDAISALTDQACRELQGMYFESASQILGPIAPDHIVLDKLPLNLIDLPLIARVFPDAPLIVCLRDPHDACISNAMQHMTPNPSMKALAMVDTGAKFAAELLGLWCEARESLRMNWTESRYEELVHNPEAQLAALLDRCGITPADSVSASSNNNRIVGTPSYEAISKGVNIDAIGRWKRYAPVIDSRSRKHVETTLSSIRQQLGYQD